MQLKVFVSSTQRDLFEHRKFLDDQLRRAGQFSVLMETSGAVPADPTTVSRAWVRDCDVFIGLYAFRYGTISPEDAEGRSITELEYEEARRLCKRCLCYFADGSPPAESAESPEARAKLEAFKQRIARDLVRGRFTQPETLVGVMTDLASIMAGEPLGFDRADVLGRLETHVKQAATALAENDLGGREPLVPSPLDSIWKEILSSDPWHVRQKVAVNELMFVSKTAPELKEVAERAGAIDWSLGYPELTRALRDLANNTAFAAVEALERREVDRGQAPLAAQAPQARVARARLAALRGAARDPEYRRCLLLTGRLGAGKTHFLASAMATSGEAAGALVIPLGTPQRDLNVEAAVLRAVREALGQPPNETGGLRSLGELDALCRPTKLFVAIDELEVWVRLDPAFLARLEQTIPLLSRLTSLHWLFVIDHQEIDRIAGRTEFFDRWGFLGNRKRDRAAEGRRDNPLPPNIGGWIDVEVLDQRSDVGVEIVARSLAHEGKDAEATVTVVRGDQAAKRSLTLPFTAWTFVDMCRDGVRRALDTRFIGFVEEFWRRRSEKLVRALTGQSVRDAPAVLQNLVHGLADWMLQRGDFEPEHRTLRQAMLADPRITSVADAEAIDLALNALEGAALLRVERVESDGGFVTKRFRLGFELFWEYHLAFQLCADHGLREKPPAEILGTFTERLKGLPGSSMHEGVLAFALLLLDDWAERGNFSRTAVTKVWRSVATTEALPRASVWFAGVQASRTVQETVARARTTSRPTDARCALALMYFAARADKAALDPPGRLALLQPYLHDIAEFGLGDYFRYVAELQIEPADAEELLRCMAELTGCEPTGAAEALGQLCANRLVEHGRREFSKAFDLLLRFLVDHRPGRVDQRPDNGPGWRRTFLAEHVLHGFCEWLVGKHGVETFDLLRRARWYDASSLGCEPPLPTFMDREANLALGYWFQREHGSGQDKYVALVQNLAQSSSTTDLDTAFHLIRHSVPTYGQMDVHPDRRFSATLASLVQNPQFSERTLSRYEPMLRLNLPSFEDLVRQRGSPTVSSRRSKGRGSRP